MAFFEGTLLLLKIQSDFLICFIFHVSFCQQPLSFSQSAQIFAQKSSVFFFCGRTTQTTLKVESFNHLSPGLGSLPCRVHVLHLELRYHQSAMAMFLWTRWARGGWCLIVGRKIYLSRGGNLSPLQCEFQCDVVMAYGFMEDWKFLTWKFHTYRILNDMDFSLLILFQILYKNNLKRHTCCWYMLIHLIDVDAMLVLGDLFVSKSSDQIQHRPCCNLQDETWENLFESAGLEVKLMISPPLALGERSSSARVFERQGGGTLDI